MRSRPPWGRSPSRSERPTGHPVSPTSLLAALVGLAALTTFALGPAIPLLALVGLAAATAVDAWWVRRPPRVHREVAELLSRGVAEPLRIEVEAPSAVGVEIRQPLGADLELEPQQVRGRSLEGELVARRRGRHALAPVAVRLRGPLGLASWTRSVGEEVAVEVYPDLPAARRAAAAARHSVFRDPGFRGRGPLGLGTEFESIREYSPDDDIRQVNWRATARLDRPMSNDYRLEQDRDLICVLDAGRLMQAPLRDRTRLDAAVDAVAALAAVADEVGDRLGVHAFDSEVRVWLPPGRKGGRRGLRALYDLEPSSEESDYGRAFQQLERAKRSMVFLFTDLVEEVAARPLVGAMPVLARKHAVTLVSPRDQDLEEAITEAAPSLHGALRASVALDVLEARSRAGATARSVGAEVVEAPADKLASACVQAYLRAKRRGRA